MSIQVKTPTRTQFEHVEFACGEKQPSAQNVECYTPKDVGEVQSFTYEQESQLKSSFVKMDDVSGSGSDRNRKRRHSERSLGPSPNSHMKRKASFSGGRRHGLSKNIQPTKFLLGGNITDPLNLNSLCDEQINAALNEHTPQSSPLPMPAHRHQPIHVFIPANICDPLNLNAGEDVDVNLISPKYSRKKRNKHKNRKRLSAADGQISDMMDESTEADPVEDLKTVRDNTAAQADKINEEKYLDICKSDNKPVVANLETKELSDKVVAPILSHNSPKGKKRKRNSGDSKLEDISSNAVLASNLTSDASTSRTNKDSPRRKFKKQSSNQSNTQQPAKYRRQDAKFTYGNYNRYYGYRNPAKEEDCRILGFEREWFDEKDVLDIGCNVGHMTLTLARDFNPHKVTGIDIDAHLIRTARRNVCHYLAEEVVDTSKYPLSLTATRGPLAVPGLPEEDTQFKFPHNVTFMQTNYVLERDELLTMQREEFDIVLALSITKWVHLNWGDDGLKRFFKRIYKQLRPGGRLILEPQSWASYKKKKKLTEEIFTNYQMIHFKPDQFTEYLLSREVGFGTCRQLRIPYNKSKGFQRPVYLFTKTDSDWNTPRPGFYSSCVTPSVASGRPTPHFDFGSSGMTPCSSCKNTPNYTVSAGTTPRCSLCCGTPTSGSMSEWSKSTGLTPDRDAVISSPGCVEDSTSNNRLPDVLGPHDQVHESTSQNLLPNTELQTETSPLCSDDNNT